MFILILWLAARPVSAQQQDGGTDLIELSLGYGFGFPPLSGLFVDSGSESITRGLIAEDLIHRVFIQRRLAERIFLDLDYDSDRQGGFFYGDNIYSLEYQGVEEELLRAISVGNRYLSIPDTRMLPIDEGNFSSYALRVRMERGPFAMQALARYSQAITASKHFRGGSQMVDTEVLDVSYLKRRYYLLPDREIDEPSLRLYRSSEVPKDVVVDGGDFALLRRGEEYCYDNSTGRIVLNRSLFEEEQLLVYYEKGGFPVGSGLPPGDPMGRQAIITEVGQRDDFTESGYGSYFGTDGGSSYLYLRKIGLDSYWEIKSAYLLAEVYGGAVPTGVTLELFDTATGRRNDNYDALLDSHVLDPERGVILFTFEDETQADDTDYYPRPFPAEEPYDPLDAPYADDDPRNPFDPDHPIYGGSGDPEVENSVNTLLIRYAVEADGYFLDFDIVEGSVRVTVDGLPLGSSLYNVDYYSGTITFTEGVIGPTSDIEVRYRYTPITGGEQELLLALALDYRLDWLQLRNLTAFDYPLTPPAAPLLGLERGTSVTNSTELAISLGAPEGEPGFSTDLSAGAAFALGNGNHRRAAVVADMEQIGLRSVSQEGMDVLDADEYFTRIEQVDAGQAEVGTDAFSAAYADVYAELHGDPSYRERYGGVEQVLICDFAPSAALDSGKAVYLSRSFGYLADLSGYEQLRLYVFLPVGQTVPSAAAFSLVLLGSSADRLEIAIPGSAIGEGWNEIVIDLETPYRLRINGSAAGQLVQSGGTNPLSHVSEIRFGVMADGGVIPTGSDFTFWLDEWHLAESRFSLDAALYGEGAFGYRGAVVPLGHKENLALLADPMVTAGFEHREGSFLDSPQRRRDSWSAAFNATLFGYVPLAVGTSGYQAAAGGLFREPAGIPAPELEDRDNGWSYSHRIGIDSIQPFLPALEHMYVRSVSEREELVLGDSGYVSESINRIAETLSFTEILRYPQGVEQSYRLTRSWLYDDPELSILQTHAGRISYAPDLGFISLELSSGAGYDLATSPPTDTVFASYAERMGNLFRSIPAAHPGALPASRADSGRLILDLPRQDGIGFALDLDTEFSELDFQAGGATRDLAVEAGWDTAIPLDPGSGGTVELKPRMRRSFCGRYDDAAGDIRELWLLGQSWKRLVMPPLYYLNPRFDRGRLNEYEAVDLLASSGAVSGPGEATLDTSLGLDLRLRDLPGCVPARGSVEVAGKTGRQGQSYTQSRSVRVELGADLPFRREPDGGRTNRLRLDAGWEGSREYAAKIFAHSFTLDTELDLFAGVNRRLSADHRLSLTLERQRIGDERLLLFPGQPDREPAVSVQPDRDTLSSTLGLQYLRQRRIDSKRWELLAASFAAIDGESVAAGRIAHADRFELENTFLIAERTELSDTTVEPLRLLYTHSTSLTVSEHLDLQLDVKTIAGVEEIISGGSGEYQPALGFELRLSAILNF